MLETDTDSYTTNVLDSGLLIFSLFQQQPAPNALRGKSEGCSECDGSRVTATLISHWHCNTPVACLCSEVVFSMFYSQPYQRDRSLSSFKSTG